MSSPIPGCFFSSLKYNIGGGMKKHELEEGRGVLLDFKKLAKIRLIAMDVLPVIVQNYNSGEVLMLAYTNRDALELSLHKNIAIFWSTSKNKLWIKGITSGCFLSLIEIRVNCEQNSLLYLVIPMGNNGGMCHTKNESNEYRKSCFYRRMVNVDKLNFI